MNKRSFLNIGLSSLLTSLGLLGALGCLATGMGLNYRFDLLVAGCVVMALLCSFLMNTKAFPYLLVAVSAYILWRWGQPLRLCFESLIYHISDLYDRGYGWGILQWTDRTELPRDITPALLAMGLPIALAISFTLRKGWLNSLAILLSLLPLTACLVLTDTVPAEPYLGILLFVVILLILTGRVRRQGSYRADTLTLTLALPLILGLTLLFTLCPQKDYHMQSGAQKLEDWVMQFFPEPIQADGDLTITGDQARSVDLSQVGKRNTNNQRIMTVRGEENATVYLRGCAYDIYNGKGWSCAPGWNAWNLFYSAADSQVRSLTIKTDQPHSVYYFTYAPYASPAKVLGGRMRNEDDLTQYTVYYQTPATYNTDWDNREDAIGGQDLSEYLQLPESTREGAMAILTRKIGVPTETYNTGQIWKNALYITEWVQHRAKYDLNTGKMPKDAEDFALWFLNEADTGYCTHYATAATVLLRAAGIPAQYVTGYLVELKDGRAVTVTEENAHAWVEVFINGVGWVMLEPTPAGGVSQTIGREETSPTEESLPIPTEPPATETTPPATTEESLPPATTAGTEGTAPTEESFYHPTATVPSSTDRAGVGGADPGTPGNRAMETPIKTLLWILAGLGLLLSQWRIRVALKKASCRRGSPNRRALQLWNQLSFACHLAKKQPSEDCLLLAQKARFSQHTLTEEELQSLQKALLQAQKRLKKRCFLLQPIYTLLLAIY